MGGREQFFRVNIKGQGNRHQPLRTRFADSLPQNLLMAPMNSVEDPDGHHGVLERFLCRKWRKDAHGLTRKHLERPQTFPVRPGQRQKLAAVIDDLSDSVRGKRGAKAAAMRDIVPLARVPQAVRGHSRQGLSRGKQIGSQSVLSQRRQRDRPVYPKRADTGAAQRSHVTADPQGSPDVRAERSDIGSLAALDV